MSSLANPPLTPKAVATRLRLLELSAELFVQRGYAAVSLRDIADEAEVTKGAIYGHFKSKGQLLVEVIRHLQAKLDEDINFDAGADHTKMLDLFIRPEDSELRLLQVDAAAAARHDIDVADGIAELHELRTRWVLDNVGSSYADPATSYFVIAALSAGVGVEEAFGRELPNPDAWRTVMSEMLAPVMKGSK